MKKCAVRLFLAIALCPALYARAGGPLGIDHRLSIDNDGLWKRSNQTLLLGAMVTAEVVGAVWEGGNSRFGKTLWQAIDATTIGAVSSGTLKLAFTRARPSRTDNPNQWFQGRSHDSFPSFEVTAVSAIVTPFVLEYGREYPAVYALELLPLYDAVARMKVRGHWQTDVLAGFALGTAAGYLSHLLPHPLVLSVLPHGFAVGLKMNF